MPDNVYRCPECGANLKLAKAVEPGKKIRCPKCQHVFAPTASADAAPPARPKAAAPAPKPAASPAKAKAAPAKPAPEPEETYGVIKEPEPRKEPDPPDDDDEDEDAPARGKKKKAKKAAGSEAEDPLKKTFPKGKRGPAAAILQAPTNQLLGTSGLACVSCIITIIYVLWPIAFEAKTPKDVPERLLWIGVTTFTFVYNAVIAVGAVKMQNIESYVWAIIASVMMVLPLNWVLGWPAFYWFIDFFSDKRLVGEENSPMIWWATIGTITIWYTYVGVWNILKLQDETVKAGFQEKRVDY
jgi:DNA-directed RNA polymerase subunit RPC12/RpoP